MKIVIIGGSGLIGTKLVKLLRAAGHEAVPASPRSGVNTLTGEGLSDALRGAQVVVDVTNSPSFEDTAVMNFFQTSTRNLLRTEKEARVGHHVAVSIVGADRNADSGYLRAKVAQEGLIQSGGVPYSILRATQFFEFLGAIAGAATEGEIVRLPPAAFQPIAANDVATALADVVLAAPVNGIVEVAGPDRLPMSEIARRFLLATGNPRRVVADEQARYFGAKLDDRSLTPDAGARIGATSLERWLSTLGKGHESRLSLC